jgi:predicted peroxiredoxin
MSEKCDTVVVLTTGKSDRGSRATIAFGWACTALAMGKEVALFLTMDGSSWAVQGATENVQVEGFEPLHSYLEQFLGLGGRLYVCAPCTKYYCGFSREGMGAKLHPAAQIAGLSTVVGLAGPGAQVVTF